MPAGIIALWSGTLTSIPAGWALCDGTQGTPDLRDRFVRGAPAGQNPGGLGGATSHTHANHADHIVTQPANHANHVVTQPADHTVTQPAAHTDHASHTHDIASSIATPDLFAAQTGGSGVSGRTGGPSATLTHSAHTGTAVSPHSGTAVDPHSAHTGTAVDPHSAHSTADHLPPYYAVAFIMKLA
ncbi:MAG: hypothetical protein QN122_13510 [Armatimonadota bacterium]|nr:hypothetical protein [Armatimonadota bacterium]